MRKRTRSREIALQMLYQVDARGPEVLNEFEDVLTRDAAGDPDLAQFARELVKGTLEMQAGIDKIISLAAQNWHLNRMAIVDRNILRMAVYEMLHAKDIPSKVSINEAIELGKRYSTEQSGSFINGILDRIRREQNL